MLGFQQDDEVQFQQKPPTLSLVKQVHLLPEDIKDQRKVIIILEKAGLRIERVGKREVLLNSDEHSHIIQSRLHKDPVQFRPDITHQCLLTLLDSPLNKAGRLKILISTMEKQIIEVHPSTRIPRTYKRFAPLMVQLLKKLRIRAEQSTQTLLRILKNPITSHLPPDSLKIGTSTKARFVEMNSFIDELPKNAPIIFVVGAVAKGNPAMEVQYVQDSICVSKYPLSAAYAICKILCAFEDKWGVV